MHACRSTLEDPTEARLTALKTGLLLMACVALLTIWPASRLPDYKPEGARR